MGSEVLSEMEITYELKNADYVDSSALAARSRSSVFVLDVVVTGSLFVGGLLCCGFGYFLPGLLLPVLGWLYMMKRIYGWKTMRPAKAMQQDNITLKLSERGIEYQSTAGTLAILWPQFSHLIEDEYRILLIVRGQKVFIIIPKRAFANEQQLHDARRYFGKLARLLHPPIAKPH